MNALSAGIDAAEGRERGSRAPKPSRCSGRGRSQCAPPKTGAEDLGGCELARARLPRHGADAGPASGAWDVLPSE